MENYSGKMQLISNDLVSTITQYSNSQTPGVQAKNSGFRG
jgi:hypothetical protein